METKNLSHRERLTKHCDCCVESSNLPTIRKVRVQRVVGNRVINKVELKTIDRASEMKPYRSSDFAMDNLLAVGAKLDPTRLIGSPLKNIDDMARTLDSVIENTNLKNE